LYDHKIIQAKMFGGWLGTINYILVAIWIKKQQSHQIVSG